MVESQLPNNPASGLSPLRGTFVGRQREMGELKAALNDALSGQGRVVMLVGEPGIGKTRTTQELASYAETSGAQVLWGRCFEDAGAPPYWPWLQSLRSHIQQQTPEQLQSKMGLGAADIAEIVPEIRHKLTDLESPPALEPEQARFRLFDSITTFLKNAAQSKPLLLALDDLHWADRSSLLLLEFVAREIESSPLLVLGTYRDVEVSRRHPLSETLGNLIREQRFLRVQLPGLAEREVEQLIQEVTSVSPPPGLSATIHRRTEGNPLFVGEIIRMLPGVGLGEGRDYLTSIPEGVRDAIGRRLNHLSEGCNQVLTTASVIGREFDFRVLRGLSGDISEERLLKLVDEGLEGHIIEELPQMVGRYQFTHVLIQETLAAELTLTRRVMLHGRIAETLEEFYGADAEAHAAELAVHFAEAEPVLGPDKLVRYSLLAGDQALAAYAYEDAITHFERGLVSRDITLSGTEAASDEESAALLFGLGRAQAATLPRQQLEEAVTHLRSAFDYYTEVNDVIHAVAVATTPIQSLTGQRTGIMQIITRAQALVTPDSHAEGRLLARYGYELGQIEGDYQGGQEALNRALAIAQRENDKALEMVTLATATDLDVFHTRYQECVEKSLRIIDLAGQINDPRSEAYAHLNAARSLTSLGARAEANHHAESALDQARRIHDHYLLVIGYRASENLARLQGDWKIARQFSEQGLEFGPHHAPMLAQRALLEYEVGNFDNGELYLNRLLETMRVTSPGPTNQYVFTATALTVIARISGVHKDLDVAEQSAEIVLSSPHATVAFSMWARSSLALLAVLRGDGAGARAQYDKLLPVGGVIPQIGTSVDRLLGLLSQTMGQLDQAITHFEDALTFCRKAEYRPELAWTCSDYADTLIPRNNSGDHARSISLLSEALAISSELGMRPLMERVVALQKCAESKSETAPAYPDGLTAREVEVLKLVATGKTDREISDKLSISVTTVSTHVRNLLNKTNTTNRTQAASYAAQHSLL